MSVVSTCIKAYREDKKIVFFGTGSYSNLWNIQPLISFFCDNSSLRQGSEFYGLPIFPPDKLLEESKSDTLIIINTEYYQEIAKQLLDMGFEHVYSNEYRRANERIPLDAINQTNFLRRKYEVITHSDFLKVKSLFADDLSQEVFDNLLNKYKYGDFNFADVCNQDYIYFNDIFRANLTEDEVYIDAGVYDGRTLVDFIRFTHGKYKRIYAFEPDLIGFTALKREFLDCENMILSQSGLSDVDGEAYFDIRGTMISKTANCDKGEDDLTKITTVKLDSIIDEPVTLIKMDIEGGEYKALCGSRETIVRCKPKLAISVYHELDDLIRIPLLVHSMVPEYKLYLRHHTVAHVDTVLYAKP